MRVRRVGKSYAHPLLVLIVTPSGLERCRIGISAGRSVGGAVERNRAKRMLREAARQQLAALRPGYDIILLARQPIVTASLAEIETALGTLAARAGVLTYENLG